MILKIRLLSDLCTGSGEGFNSTVDTDAVFDDYGFPYIPAKRLKGCIRESCLELEEFGVISAGSEKRIFGKEGDQPSLFTLSDAYLENYQDLVSDILAEEDKLLTSYQNVVDLYSYTRTQTSLDSETGTAEKNSLRTIRVVKKGLNFKAGINFCADMKLEEREIFKMAAELVTHMGIHRTRGLGLIKITLEETEQKNTPSVFKGEIGEKNKLSYSIFLCSPMINKCAEGNQTRTQLCIEGGKLLGLLADTLGKEKFDQLLEQELVISNAYIMHNGKRCTPLPASFQKRKDQTFDNENKMEVCDMLYTENIQDQMTPLGGMFADSDGYVMSVETEINYHHRRPSDKSIGHAVGNEESAFYQMESIRKGQRFGGIILASRKQTEMICNAFSSMRNIRMGYGKNTQYGAVELSIDQIESAEKDGETQIVHDFQVKLNAPVILYNINGMYSADADDFCLYLSEILGVSDLLLKQRVLTYEAVGGFNVKWKRRKPIFTAIGKGSVCTFHTDTGIPIKDGQVLFVGERVSEGYGEISISTQNAQSVLLRRDSGEKRVFAETEEKRTKLISSLARRQCFREIQVQAVKDADLAYRDCKNIKEADAVTSRLLQICREQKNVEDMNKQAEGIESDIKRNLTKKLTEKICNSLKLEYPSKKHIVEADQVTEEEIYAWYSSIFLQQLKYRLRSGRSERREAYE